ncbi:PAS domain S-box protein [Geomonas limicola]|nr:PAS domain S-box protein [Geomonas limicola]
MLRGILDAAIEEAIVLFDKDGCIRLANPTAFGRFGKSEEEMNGRSPAEFLEPALWEARWAMIRQVLETGEPLEFEDERTGIAFHHSLSPVRDVGGRVAWVVSFSRDITVQKQAEASLRLSEEKYAKIFSTNPAAIALTLLEDGTFLDVNDTWCQLVGYRRDEVLGVSARQLGIWPDPAEAAHFVAELKQWGRLNGWQKDFFKRSGERFSTQLSAQLIEVAGQTVVVSCLIDVTERKRIQERYEQQVRLFDGVAATTPDFVYVFDRQGRFLYANKRLLEVLGMQLPEVVGKTCLELGYQRWHHDMHMNEIREVIRTRCPLKGEVPFKAPLTGVYGIYEYIFTPVLGPDGGVELIAGTTRDVTDRRRAEDELRKAHELLEIRVLERTAELENTLEALHEKEHLLLQQSRLAAMGEMLSNISHQWRQPLNLLGLNIQGLALMEETGGASAEVIRETTERCMELILYMSRTIDDFRNFFKPDKEKSHFRLSEVVTAATKLMEGAFNSRSAQIEVAELADCVVYGYPGEYSQVVVNILNNAKDAFETRQVAEPRVLLTLDARDGRSLLTIEDNAGGIPEEHLPKIFEPHFSTKGPQGSGIGLFMSKNIIEKNMNGRLTVRNTASGAQFCIEV